MQLTYNGTGSSAWGIPTNASGVLNNDGSGGLSWVPASGGTLVASIPSRLWNRQQALRAMQISRAINSTGDLHINTAGNRSNRQYP